MSGDQEYIDKLVTHLKTSRGEAPTPHHNGHASMIVETAAALTDQDVLKLLFGEKGKGAQWEATYSGAHEQHYPSASEAVAALLLKLAFYTRKDPAQMDRLIRGSALASPKFDERRSGTTWLAREIQKAIEKTDEVYTPGGRGRLVSSLSSPIEGSDDDDTSEAYKAGKTAEDVEDEPEVVWFHELGEPKEREYLIAKVGVKGYPIIVFGAGGVAKSFGVLAAGVAIASASGLEDWLGMRVIEHGHVLYLDFELDVDEQHRRVRDLCNGFGIPTPKRLAYVSGVGVTVAAAFRRAGRFAKEHEPKAIIIDSLGLAIEGDMERGKDVLAFYRKYIDPFRRMGITPIIVDHEGKLQVGEKHKNKSPIGSAYKAWAARNVLQFELEEYDKENSALDIRVRQTKTNFTPITPFGVRFTFEEKKVSIEPRELPDADLADETRVPLKERIRGALRNGPATSAELQKLTGAEVGSIRNKLSELMQSGEVTADNSRPKNYELVSSSSLPSIGDDSDDTSDESQNDQIEEF